jgi:hypothetical protein
MPLTDLYPILIEKSLISPVVLRPYNGPQRRDFNPNSTCDFHFGEVGHTVENCSQLKHRVQDLIDHGVLKFEGLPNITTNPLPNHLEGGVNMVEIEEMGEERIAWRRLFYTLEKQRHITPLEAPPGPSTGDACEYHSGARGCHNPIFTPGIFSGVDTQNEAARTKSACSDKGSSPQILPKRRSGTHFPRFDQV